MIEDFDAAWGIYITMTLFNTFDATSYYYMHGFSINDNTYTYTYSRFWSTPWHFDLVKLEILFSCILSVYLQHNASIALPGVVPFEKLYCFTF